MKPHAARALDEAMSMNDLASALMLKAQASKNQVSIHEARYNEIAFLECAMTDEHNRPIVVDNFTKLFVECWRSCLAANRHLSFTAPPGLGKSSLARMMMMYLLGKNTSSRAVIIGAVKGDSQNAVNLCRSVALSHVYREIFPKAVPDIEKSMDARGWKMGEWYFRTPGQRKDPTMLAAAGEPKGEALRVDYLLADDLVTQKNYEGAVHEKLVRAFFNTWIEGRLSNGGWCCYLQNVRGKNDLLHRLRIRSKFCSVWVGVTPDAERMFVKVWNPPPRFPVIERPQDYGLTVVPVDPEEQQATFQAEMPLPRAWTKERLLAIEPSAYKTMYRLQGADPTDLLVPSFTKRTKFPGRVAEMLNLEEVGGLPVMGHLDRHRLALAAGLDISGQKRRGMAFWIIGKDRGGKIYPIEFWQIKGSLHEVIDRIDGAWKRGLWFQILNVESNSVQSTLREAMKAILIEREVEWAWKIEAWQTGSNKYDPQLGLPALDVEFATGQVVWPDEMSRGAEASEIAQHWRLFEAETAAVTREVSRLTTPDGLMAYWFAHEGLKRVSASGDQVPPVTVQRIERTDIPL